MRKIFIALAAVVVTLAIAAPHFASAAEIKMTGIYRFRGVTGDDFDRNDKAHDSRQSMDWLARPRWTAVSEGGKVFAIYELDVFDRNISGANGNVTFGTATSRLNVGLNRWVIDAAIPGTTLRFRVGKSDWTDPSNEIIGGAGLNRIQGFGVYGKLMGPLTLSLWTVKYNEGLAAAADGDLYHLSVAWKAAPSILITPWLAWDHLNNGCTVGTGNATTPACTATRPDIDMWYYGVNLKAKFGIASLNLTGVIQDGEVEFGRGAGRSDIDVQAYAALIRLWFNFGKLKVGFYGHFFSGDDDDTTAVGGATGTALLTGRQGDNKLKRFSGPRQNGTSRLVGPQLVTRRRFSTLAVFGAENRGGGGNGGTRMNGAQIYELLIKYKITKALTFDGNISLIRSAERRVSIDANFDGDTLDAGDMTYDSAKDFGTEIDLSLKYQIYKTMFARLTFAYLIAGDYGKLKTVAGVAPATGTQGLDDTWALYSELRHYW